MTHSTTRDEETAGATMATGLIWGIKDSFLAYLGRMPDLRSSVTDGAMVTPAGGYYFPFLSGDRYDAAAGQGELEFGGDVRFSGHHGMLFVRLAEPWVSFDGDRATLSVVTSATTGRVSLLDLAAGAWSEHYGARAWPNVPTTLRPEGLELFNEVYPAGEPFAPVDLRVRV